VSGLRVVGLLQGFSRGRGANKHWLQLLSDVSFDVRRGEVVAVVGRPLSGKTTLLNFAAGLGVPEAGSVILGDVELNTLSRRKRAMLRRAGVIWVNRVGMSQKLQVAKMVGWPLVTRRQGRRETERRANEMLERVGAAHCAQQRWDDLSHWEQLLAGLAQGFALSEPRIVVVDDLFDGLGEPRTRQAFDLVRSLIQEANCSCGVLTSVTDTESSLYADRVWSLENASLIPTAGHREGHAEVVPLRPDHESGGSRRVGWS
jgi:ABC-type lipoprotein export system ATPase subunit